jgi:hypothetical protein
VLLFINLILQSEYYHIIDAISYFVAAAVPIYFLVKSRNGVKNNPLRKVTLILAGFLIAQGAYHAAGIFGFHLLSKVILEPLSAAVLVLVALLYFLTIKGISRQKQAEVGTLAGK